MQLNGLGRYYPARPFQQTSIAYSGTLARKHASMSADDALGPRSPISQPWLCALRLRASQRATLNHPSEIIYIIKLRFRGNIKFYGLTATNELLWRLLFATAPHLLRFGANLQVCQLALNCALQSIFASLQS